MRYKLFCLAVDGFSSAYYNSPFLNVIYIYIFYDLKLPFHALVVPTVDSPIHQINHCLMDKHNLAKPMCYSMDRDLCGG